MKNKKYLVRALLVIVALAALGVCIWCVCYLVQYYNGNSLNRGLQALGPDGGAVSPETESVDIPVDFAALHEINPDIYAWVTVPGTDISYPVLQREGDNGYYVRRSADGSSYTGGCIFSEDYNSKDFGDAVTVLYGHNLKNGTMFAPLNDFADAEVFEGHRQIVVYTEDKMLVYEVFAAVPHSHEHLLLTYDFDDAEVFAAFFDELFSSKSLKSQLLEGGKPESGDKVIVLSTCLRQDNTQRYLVFGRLISEIPAK